MNNPQNINVNWAYNGGKYYYDTYGNRDKMYVTGIDSPYSTYYTYDKNNRLTSETKEYHGDGNEKTKYYYDPNGNLISKAYSIDKKSTQLMSLTMMPSNAFGSGTYEYDGFNRLTKSHEAGAEYSYTYNADGLRTSKTVGGVTTKHIWDGTNIAAETNGSNTVQSVYTRGISLISAKKGSTKTYYLHNGHGDVNMLMDANGNITKEYTYDAFGVEQNMNTSDTNPFRYCGEYYDKESGNIYLRARYYTPKQGRFITEDPIKDGLNWYVYCSENPVNAIDPTGLDIYYFVNHQFRDQADRDAKTLTDEYEEPIHIIEVNTKQEFIDEWNWMGCWDGEQVDVNLVVINMHGDPYSIAPIQSKGEQIKPEDLMSKNIGGMILLTCNAGHYDHRYNNFANKMLIQNNTEFVTASDGEVTQANFGRAWYDKGIKYTTAAGRDFYDNTWKHPIEGHYYRSNLGFIKYTKNEKGELVTYIIDEYNPRTELYITQLN